MLDKKKVGIVAGVMALFGIVGLIIRRKRKNSYPAVKD